MAGARMLHWNGKDVPDELRDLPAGIYIIETVDGAHTVTPDDENGLRVAMASPRGGKGRSVEQVRQTIDAVLRR